MRNAKSVLEDRAQLTIRRVRLLKEDPYSQKEAEISIGLATDNGRRQHTAMDTDEVVPDASAALMDTDVVDAEDDTETHNAFFSAYEANAPVKP